MLASFLSQSGEPVIDVRNLEDVLVELLANLGIEATEKINRYAGPSAEPLGLDSVWNLASLEANIKICESFFLLCNAVHVPRWLVPYRVGAKSFDSKLGAA